MFAAFRTGVVDAVVFHNFYLCRDKYQFTANKLFAYLYQWCITYGADFFFFRKIQIFPCNRDAFETFRICCPGFPLFRCKDSVHFFHLCGSRVLFLFSFIKKIQLSRKISRSFLTGRTKDLFAEQVDLCLEIIPFLHKCFFPFVCGINSCLKRFYHFSQIVDHVLQLPELKIFGTV